MSDVYTIIRGEFPCKWCDAAIEFVSDRGYEFTVMKLPMGDLILKQAEVGHQTVPMVFHGDRFIGGFSELEAYNI